MTNQPPRRPGVGIGRPGRKSTALLPTETSPAPSRPGVIVIDPDRHRDKLPAIFRTLGEAVAAIDPASVVITSGDREVLD